MEKPTLLLVGLGPGLSRALSEEFARNGYRIAFVVRRAEEVQTFTELLTSMGIDSLGAEADAGQPESLSNAIDRLQSSWGVPEVMLYNVSIFRAQLPTEINPEEFVVDFRLNVLGALVSTQAVLPGFRARGGGTLLYTGGASALSYSAAFTSLGVGKGAMRHLVHCIADEVCKEGIAVGTFLINGAIKPGTPFDPERIAPAYYRFFTQLTPTGPVETIFNGD